MDKLLINIDTECKYCSKSSILLSYNLKEKQYFLYIQNNNLTLFEVDDNGMVILDEIRIGYCMYCGRVLSG